MKQIRKQVCDRKGNSLANKHVFSSMNIDFVKPRVSYYMWGEYTRL